MRGVSFAGTAEWMQVVVVPVDIDGQIIGVFELVNAGEANWEIELSSIQLVFKSFIFADSVSIVNMIHWVQVGKNTPEKTFLVFVLDVQNGFLSRQLLWCWEIGVSPQWSITVDVKVDKIQLVYHPTRPTLNILLNFTGHIATDTLKCLIYIVYG